MRPIVHERLGPGLHRFVFASASRGDVTHELLVDLQDDGPGRYSCLCEAGLRGRLCKHKRAVMDAPQWLREDEASRDGAEV